MKAMSDNNEISQKMKKGTFRNMVLNPFVTGIFCIWFLAAGKAQTRGWQAVGWFTLCASFLAIILFIYSEFTNPTGKSSQGQTRNLKTRFWLRSIPAVLAILVIPPSSILVLEYVLGVKQMAIQPYNWGGVIMISIGLLLNMWTWKYFLTIGRGTTFPSEPTEKLIIQGPYQYTRNPMVLGTVIFYLGIAIFFGSYFLLIYAVISFIYLQIQSTMLEEPEMEARFGQDFLDYKARVPMWFPRLGSKNKTP